jgi:hypothetical protein
MVSMKCELPKDCMPMMASCAGSPFPYGLRISLNQEQLETLGYDELPPAGTKCRIEAVGCVVRATSEDPDADGDCDYLCVELQITEMGMEEEEASEEEDDDDDGDRAGRMYGKKEEKA